MAKPKATDRQKYRAYRLWAELKFGPTAIHERLETEFKAKGSRKPVSIDTVKKWIAVFKKLDIDLDQPFHWHEMDLYGIPWEASGIILRIWKEVTQALPFLDKRKWYKSGPPTIRQVRWWWRVFKAVTPTPKGEQKHLTPLDCALLGDTFASEEIINEVLGYEPNFDGLFAYLAFRPWASDEAGKEYLEAIKNHQIPSPISSDRNLEYGMRVLGVLEDLEEDSEADIIEIAAFLPLHRYGMALDPTLTPTEDFAHKLADLRLSPQEQQSHMLMHQVRYWHLQGLDDDEIKRRKDELRLDDFWARDTEGDGFVIVKHLDPEALDLELSPEAQVPPVQYKPVEAPIEEYQSAIKSTHSCDSTWINSVPVKKVHQGQTVWDGSVQVLELNGHPTATRCYAWVYTTPDGARGYNTLLHSEQIDSPEAAVRAVIANEYLKRAKRPGK